MFETTSYSDQAQHASAIVFCCDRNFYPYALFAASRIAELEADRDFDICICSDEPLEMPEGLKPHNIWLLKIDCGTVFSGFDLDARRSQATYLRLALPTALAADYKRILYLDSDVFPQRGGFSALFTLDLKDAVFGAVRDNQQWRHLKRQPEDYVPLKLDAAPYFNAGVLLIDTETWLEVDALQHCLDTGAKYQGRLRHKDQTLLNIAFQGRWAELSPTWNWQYSWKSRLLEAMKSPHLVHFIGKTKPWVDPEQILPPRFAICLREFLMQHMPSASLPRIPLGAAAQPRLMRRMGIRHAVDAYRSAAYLSRFADDLSVLR
ncbi:glycosyltransferase family 8 protein [Pseudoroseicyclus aestuarii]|uniref:Lipopolysaccharide biosynthesis glycosyltransferase n=1 Tax=Pseudoroseicyclus aestuarii TaxID=1795041 RepID=A0A318ST13_9RHOB|nr:glycosyltransferase family 8 protein [Pseudoroseicyclus aestuarii]PYE84612.1 lipopolysaccharide biosynthesis glycosyltransferase [Pseudoroseicyclus aestuarii]